MYEIVCILNYVFFCCRLIDVIKRRDEEKNKIGVNAHTRVRKTKNSSFDKKTRERYRIYTDYMYATL